MDRLKKILDEEVLKRDSFDEISIDKPDPMLVAREYKDEYISLICALFAYGNARLIVKFLSSLDFSLIDESEEKIRNSLGGFYYRFQKPEDVINIFITLRRAKLEFSLEDIFLNGYKNSCNVLDGLNTLINKLLELNKFKSHGYQFLIGSPPSNKSKSAYKRWNMYLRWMVRSDKIDLGLWKRVDQKDLLIPLDTHTFNVSLGLGLLERRSYDLKAVIELSQKLQSFDPLDPIKYDFALYRIGQEKQKI